MIYHCGDNIMWDPPVLIPNTEVKPHRADGTVRDTVWESRTLPHFIKDIAGLKVMQCPLTYVSGAADSTPSSGYALGRRAAPSWKGRRIARLLRATRSVGAPPLWEGRRIAHL